MPYLVSIYTFSTSTRWLIWLETNIIFAPQSIYSFKFKVGKQNSCYKFTQMRIKKTKNQTLSSPWSMTLLWSPISAMSKFMHCFFGPSQASYPSTMSTKYFGVQSQSVSIFWSVASNKQLDISYLKEKSMLLQLDFLGRKIVKY